MMSRAPIDHRHCSGKVTGAEIGQQAQEAPDHPVSGDGDIFEEHGTAEAARLKIPSASEIRVCRHEYGIGLDGQEGDMPVRRARIGYIDQAYSLVALRAEGFHDVLWDAVIREYAHNAEIGRAMQGRGCLCFPSLVIILTDSSVDLARGDRLESRRTGASQ